MKQNYNDNTFDAWLADCFDNSKTPHTKSERYTVAFMKNAWYFFPNDREYTMYNRECDYSMPYTTAQEALDAAEAWESQIEWEEEEQRRAFDEQ